MKEKIVAKGKKVAFYLCSINGRGQSKVMINIAAGLSKKGYNITFFYSKMESDVFSKQYSKTVKFISLGNKSRIGSISLLRRELRVGEYDFFFTAGNDNNCIIILAKMGLKLNTKIIITEHNSISQVIKNSNKVFIRLLRPAVRFLYKYSDVLVSVSNGIKRELEQEVGVKHKKSLVIYNPVVDDSLIEMSFESVKHKWFDEKYKVFLGVGKLSVQKNFELLIEAFYKASKKDESYRLIILGDGEKKETLRSLISELNLENKVDLVGRVDNPYAYMRNSDVFVLSSKFEGLPTVIIEALACDLPVVSTDCPHGASEILEGGKWGKLVPVDDTFALSVAMEESIHSAKDATLVRAKAFTFEASVDQYDNLLIGLGET